MAHTVNLAFKDAAEDMERILSPFKKIVAECTNSAKRHLLLGHAAMSVAKRSTTFNPT